MFRKFTSRTYCVLPAILFLSLSISGCRSDEPSVHSDHSVGNTGIIIYGTDSTEWRVRVIATGKFYADAVTVPIPDPYRLPVKEEAQVLRTCTLSSSERFITADGYTFAMPSASVSKAGQKTRYSVLGLYIRKTSIDVPF